MALRDNLSLTWGTQSGWECDRRDGKLWDTCRSRAARLRSDRQHTSPRWDLPPAPLSFRTLAALRTEETALSQFWTLIQELVPEQAALAAAEASTELRCCCPAGWNLCWIAPACKETQDMAKYHITKDSNNKNKEIIKTNIILNAAMYCQQHATLHVEHQIKKLQNELHPRPLARP